VKSNAKNVYLLKQFNGKKTFHYLMENLLLLCSLFRISENKHLVLWNMNY